MTHLPNGQRGATLLVALVLLLVITLLAVSSTRESALETRITGNFVAQQKQLNYTEAVLREGEGLMTAPIKPREPACSGNYCFYTDAAKYGHEYGSCDAETTTAGIESKLLAQAGEGEDPISAPEMRWYAIEAPAGAAEGASENPEYGNMMLGIGTFRYEINGRARDAGTETCTILRSTTAKVFN